MVPILLSVAFLTLLERKVLRLIGLRVGPNKVRIGGLLQPISDAVKLSNKGINPLSNSSFLFYYISSSLLLAFSISLVGCLFTNPSPISLKYSVLLFFLILGFNSFNSILRGWRTFGKYSLIGRIRTVSQLISYEAVLYICLFPFLLIFSSFDFSSFCFYPLSYSFLFLVPCFYVWFPSFLAELNRTPYDFSEGESELVRGFNTEYGSRGFTLIFLSEYINIIFFSILTTFLFFVNFIFIFIIILFFVLWIRAVLPRYRFDKLINLAWKFFLPLLTLYFVFLLIFLY